MGAENPSLVISTTLLNAIFQNASFRPGGNRATRASTQHLFASPLQLPSGYASLPMVGKRGSTEPDRA
jgi:hypothetical protein